MDRGCAGPRLFSRVMVSASQAPRGAITFSANIYYYWNHLRLLT